MRRSGLLLFSILFLNVMLCLAQNDCVYIAGFTRDANGRQYAAYWKSGQLTKLTNGTGRDEARTIAVSGYDVHVGGFKMIGVNRVAAYWKNGQQMQLNLTGNYSGKATEVYAIKTVGNDVYIFVTQPNRMSTSDPLYYYYYKNGNPVKILISDDEIRGEFRGVTRGYKSEHFFVTANGDVYEAGVVADYDDSRDRVVYWKNGHRVTERASEKLQKTNASVQVTSIYVTPNGDVYIAGNKPTGKTASETKIQAVYWKNGNEVTVTTNLWNTYTSSIFVDGSNVYVAGYETKAPSHFSAMYWKNGIKTILHNYDTDQYDASTASIATGFGTVYVAGLHKSQLYWVNGREAKLDQAGQVYSMAIVKGGGCINNTQSSNVQANTTANSGYQSSGYTNQTQQTSLAQDVTQLAVGVSGLIASFKADKERRIAEEKQAAIAKSNAERQLAIDADNGVYDAQIKMAQKYFTESKYDRAQDYYFEAFQNTNAKGSERIDVLDDLITTLALQGKKKEIFDLFAYIKSNKIDNLYARETLAFLQLHCDEFCSDYLDCNDSIAIVQAVKEIKPYYYSGKVIGPREPDVLYGYFQVTGKYEKYGLPKNEKEGIGLLEQTLDSKYVFDQQKCAYYYLGLIYLNGTATIKADAKKALKYFKKGYERPEKVYHYAPHFSYASNTAYFEYHLLNYIKIAELYSKSEDKDDSELGKKMLNAFYTYYKPMIPNSDMAYFKAYLGK